METNIMIYIVEFAVAFMFVGVAYYIGNRYFIGFRLSNMEKKVTDYFTNEGYEWKKEDGVLNVKTTGYQFPNLPAWRGEYTLNNALGSVCHPIRRGLEWCALGRTYGIGQCA